jgi:signal transduction histidine kinase
MVALAKIGQDGDAVRILPLFAQRLRSGDQEIRETAALAMGISQMPEALPDLGGMGLTNMRQRVEEMGGTLAITSTPGQGTLVKVRIGATGSPVSEGEVAG